MSKNCPGCGAPMEYDPGFDALVCTSCGSIVDPKTLPDADSFYYEDDSPEEPQDIRDTLSEFEELTGEMYDCHVYKCSQCGGEVTVSGTEISTRCVYCGSTAVVFSRISKENRPDRIVPFSITKEEAVSLVEEKLLSGRFVPKRFKKIPPECVRGIYIPYFTYDGEISDTQQHRLGITEKSYVFDGSATFENLLVECCSSINNRFSALLEPYNLKASVEFDTSYLMGFYSNIQDVTPRRARGLSELKAKTLFQSQMRQLTPNKTMKTVSSAPKITLQRTGYVLLPAWFITINDKGTPYTFLVNGQTGKVVGTAPWDKSTVVSLTVGLSVLSIAAVWALCLSLGHLYANHVSEADMSDIFEMRVLMIVMCLAFVSAIVAIFRAGRKYFRLFENRKRTTSVTTHIFVKKRQGGVK